MITWKGRARKESNGITEARIIESKCGRYRARHAKFIVGPQPADIRAAKRAGDLKRAAYLQRQHLADEFIAMVLEGSTWNIISRHRTMEAAQRACESHERKAD